MLTLIPHRSIYQDYYSEHMLSHETQSTISWIGSVQLFFLYAGGVVGGPLFDRYGAKVSTHACTFAYSLDFGPYH